MADSSSRQLLAYLLSQGSPQAAYQTSGLGPAAAGQIATAPSPGGLQGTPPVDPRTGKPFIIAGPMGGMNPANAAAMQQAQ